MALPIPDSALHSDSSAQPSDSAVEVHERLRRSEERYRALFESMHEGFCVLELLFDEVGTPYDYRVVESNPAFERDTGLVDIVGATARAIAPDAEPHRLPTYARVALTGEPTRFIHHASSIDRYLDISVFRTGEAKQRRVGVLITDITARAKAEMALRENEERLRRAQQVAGIGTWDLDIRTGTATWSEIVYDLMGLPPQGGVPSQEEWERLLHPEDRDRVRRELRQALAAGGSYVNEFRIIRPDGATRWLASRGYVLRDAEGQPVRMLGVNFDVTERVQMEQALADLNATLGARVEEQTERVRALSRALTLAEQQERRRIAHVLHDDVQQLLVGAKMMGALGNMARFETILDEAIEKTRTLAHEMSPPFLHNEGLADLVGWLTARECKHYGLDIEVRISDNVSIPDEDLRVMLYQLLRELLLNVVKHAGTNAVRVTAVAEEGRVRVMVEDEGVGFDPAMLEEQGATLGLPSVRERLGFVGGELTVESVPGEGTCVTLDVPLSFDTISPHRVG